MIRKFILRSLLLLGPFMLILVLPAIILFFGNELYSFKDITRKHNTDTASLIGPAYSNPDKYMKLNSMIERKPRILALGTSRVMQMRHFFFTTPDAFYNAGGAVEKIDQFNFVLGKIPVETQPEVMFIGLDQYFFNINYDNLAKRKFDGQYGDNYSPLSYMFSNCFSVWKRLLDGKIKFNRLNQDDSIGLNAIVQKNGFMHDGCYYYGQRIQHPSESHDYKFSDTYFRIGRGIRRFEYGDAVNPDALNVLDSFLANCHIRNIKVYAFLPPYAGSIFEKMQSMDGKYSYINKLYSAMLPIFKKYGYAVFDFTDVRSLGLGDQHFIDGFHGSETVYLKMLCEMCRQSPDLRKYCDQQKLDELFSHAKNDLEVL